MRLRIFRAVLLIALLFVALPASAQEELEIPSIQQLEDGDKTIVSLAEEDAICWSEGGRLFIVTPSRKGYSLSTNAPSEITPFDPFDSFPESATAAVLDNTLHLFATANCLYGFSKETGNLYRYQADQWAVAYHFDTETDTVVEALANGHSFSQSGDFLCFLVPVEYAATTNRLMILDMVSGELYIEESSNIQSICAYTPGSLLAQTDGTIRVFDVSTRSLCEEALCMTDESISPIGYDGENDRVYFISGGNIYQKIGEQDPQLLRVMPDMSIEEGAPIVYSKQAAEALLALPGDTFAYVTESELCVQEAVPIGDVLRIYGYWGGSSELYQQTHPYVQISSPENDAAVFDIATISNKDNLFYLQRNNLVLDLSASNTIRAFYESFFPQAQVALGADGSPLAIPLSMEINPWFYDAEAWVEIGLPPLPENTDELFDLIDLWVREYQDKYPDLTVFVETFSGNYKPYEPCDVWAGIIVTLKNQYVYAHSSADQPINFDTPEFRKLLEDVRHVSPDLSARSSSIRYDRSRLLKGNDGHRPLWFSMARLTSIKAGDEDSRYGLTKQYVPILPPGLWRDQPPSVGALITAMVILKETENPSLALDYVTFMAAHATAGQPDLYMMLSPDLMLPPLVDKNLCAFYQQAIPYISFFINGLGSFYYDADNAYDFIQVYKDIPTADKIAEWDGFDDFIGYLNDISYRIMEHSNFSRAHIGS